MRQKAINSLRGLYEVDDFLSQLEPLTERFKVLSSITIFSITMISSILIKMKIDMMLLNHSVKIKVITKVFFM